MMSIDQLKDIAGFAKLLGLQLQEMKDGRGVVYIDLNDTHLNSAHIVHGGVYASLLDSAAGVAIYSVISQEQFAPTVSMSISYLASASKGRLVATGKVLKQGRRIIHCEAKVTCDDIILATCQATFTLGERLQSFNSDVTGS